MLVQTTRLTLRPWSASDAPAFAALQAENHEHLRPYILWSDHAYTVSDAEERISAAMYYEREGTHLYRGVFDSETGLPIGEVSAHIRTGVTRQTEPPSVVGYWLGRESEGKGLMREALAAFLPTLGVPTAYAMIDTENHRSVAVALALGFQPDGRLDQFRLFRKDLQPTWVAQAS